MRTVSGRKASANLTIVPKAQLSDSQVKDLCRGELTVRLNR